MKVISLNTWGGLAGRELLLSFFEKHSDVDIFCLQEIWTAKYEHLSGQVIGGRNLEHDKIMVDGLSAISNVLPNHVPYFRPHHEENYGLLMFIKKDITRLVEGEVFVYKEKGYIPEGDVGNHARNIQYITCEVGGAQCTVINFHGLWNGQGKGDSPDRLAQSQKIIDFMKTLKNPFVFCGDFNLTPYTESIKMFERFGLRNLITENNIISTRTRLYTKSEKYADYMFVSNGINVQRFEVLPDEVSDHAPLYIEFNM